MSTLTYEVYNQKSFAVRGDRDKFQSVVKPLGGRWNARMKGGEGWLVPREKEAELKKVVEELQKEQILDESEIKSRKNQKKYHRAVSDTESSSEDESSSVQSSPQRTEPPPPPTERSEAPPTESKSPLRKDVRTEKKVEDKELPQLKEVDSDNRESEEEEDDDDEEEKPSKKKEDVLAYYKSLAQSSSSDEDESESEDDSSSSNFPSPDSPIQPKRRERSRDRHHEVRNRRDRRMEDRREERKVRVDRPRTERHSERARVERPRVDRPRVDTERPRVEKPSRRGDDDFDQIFQDMESLSHRLYQLERRHRR